MSIFNWFTSKPPVQTASVPDSSGLGHVDATVPLMPSDRLRVKQAPVPVSNAANRKNERLERRELLYAVVRDSMIRAGVLAASYKFKVLSLDAHGRQYLIMMDLANQSAGDTGRLADIEAMIAADNEWVQVVANTREATMQHLTPVAVTGTMSTCAPIMRG